MGIELTKLGLCARCGGCGDPECCGPCDETCDSDYVPEPVESRPEPVVPKYLPLATMRMERKP